MVSFDSLDLFW